MHAKQVTVLVRQGLRSTDRHTGSVDEQSGLDKIVARAYRYRMYCEVWQHLVIVSHMHVAGNSVYLGDFGLHCEQLRLRYWCVRNCGDCMERKAPFPGLPLLCLARVWNVPPAVDTTHCKGRGAFSELLLLCVDGWRAVFSDCDC